MQRILPLILPIICRLIRLLQVRQRLRLNETLIPLGRRRTLVAGCLALGETGEGGLDSGIPLRRINSQRKPPTTPLRHRRLLNQLPRHNPPRIRRVTLLLRNKPSRLTFLRFWLFGHLHGHGVWLIEEVAICADLYGNRAMGVLFFIPKVSDFVLLGLLVVEVRQQLVKFALHLVLLDSIHIV